MLHLRKARSARHSTSTCAAAARTTAWSRPSCALPMNKPVDTQLPLADARRLTQRVHFERDGTVSIATGKVDLGQGISTALAQIAADELGIELQKIKILPASTAYSPDEGVTSGSLSIQDGGKGLRKACAELRTLLAKSGKRSFWELEVEIGRAHV